MQCAVCFLHLHFLLGDSDIDLCLFGLNSGIRVVGINVSRPKEAQEELVHSLVERTAAHLGIRDRVPKDSVLCFGDYVGPGYSRPTPEMAEAVRKLARTEAILLDLGLPGMDGLAVLRRLRARGSKTPVLILTARDAVQDRITGLDSGADDYVVKPVDLAELAARLRALIRRARGEAAPTLRHFGPGTALARLQETVKRMQTSGQVPSQLNLPGADPERVLEVAPVGPP